MKITVYGAEKCSNCNQVFNLVKNLIKELNLDIEVEKINDFNLALKKGVLSLPALALDGEIKIKGRIPKKEEIKKILNV